MAWSEKLKLNKSLLNKVIGMGYLSPKEIQQKILQYAEAYLKTKDKAKTTYTFDWESNISLPQETSVGLQHKANDWR